MASVLTAVGSFQNISTEWKLPGVSLKGYFGRRTVEAAGPPAMGDGMRWAVQGDQRMGDKRGCHP